MSSSELINMRYILLLLAAALIFSGCQNKGDSTNAPDSASANRYKLKGKVIAVDRAAKKATIQHEAIEGYMQGMTMDFPLHADWLWDDLTPGSEITAELVVDSSAKDPYWLESVGIIAVPQPGQSPLAANPNFAQVGQPAPDFTLTNQDGKHISLKDFRTLCASAAVLDVLAKQIPKGNARSRHKQVLDAVRQAADELANTPAIARKSYVHDALCSAFEADGFDQFLSTLKRCRCLWTSRMCSAPQATRPEPRCKTVSPWTQPSPRARRSSSTAPARLHTRSPPR